MKKKKGTILERFDPLADEMYAVLDNEGAVMRDGWEPPLRDDQIVDALKKMLFVRQADMMSVSYQRQGRMFTVPPNLGQEAIQVAAGMLVRPDDWNAPSFRELGTWLAMGVTLKEIFLYWRGHEDGARYESAPNVLPIAVPVASQITHAPGIGFALKQRGGDAVALSFIGDGGTSHGEFHEGVNIAAVWKVPCLFVVQNNQYAISVPMSGQTAARSYAAKAIGYGIPGVQVDGNDFLASYEVLSEAFAHVRGGNGPVLIEAVTFRRGAHTTSDDPTRYRTRELEAEWEKRDPIDRLRAYLKSRGLWDVDEEELMDQFRKEVDRQFIEAENYVGRDLNDVFAWMFEEMPEELKRQKVAYERFLNWKQHRAGAEA